MRNYPDYLLDPSRVAVAIIDHQPQMYFGVSSDARGAILNNVSLLAEAAKAFGIPCILSTVTAASFAGELVQRVHDVFPSAQIIDRTSLNAWEDENFKTAVVNTGRREIILAGLWTEICVALPAISMLADGYKVYAAVDACGGSSRTAHRAAVERMLQSGVIPLTAQQVLLELQRDWNNKETYNQVMSIVKAHGGAYGLGVEYTETMTLPAPK
ncbi:MAG: hydrolase [Oscillospiraceae bacterium]|jgi:nicotinamidase-related amidase|nr:hydrolase [Oscillospiraceae bacterium]